jgi:cell division protein FtsB
MQVWLVVGAWAFAALFAVVLLGFAGYELVWKMRRLTADRAKLDRTMAELAELAAQLRAAADRAAALGSSSSEGPPRAEPERQPG